MPWGDKTMISSNIYQHIKSRHKFDYGKEKNIFFIYLLYFFFLDTYVNYEQDEEAMIREAIQASLSHQ